jgi:hypothetical protein
MSERDELPPLTEPTIIPCLLINEMVAFLEPPNMRFVGFIHLPERDGKENRIQVRFAMPLEAVRVCHHKVGVLLGEN